MLEWPLSVAASPSEVIQIDIYDHETLGKNKCVLHTFYAHSPNCFTSTCVPAHLLKTHSMHTLFCLFILFFHSWNALLRNNLRLIVHVILHSCVCVCVCVCV